MAFQRGSLPLSVLPLQQMPISSAFTWSKFTLSKEATLFMSEINTYCYSALKAIPVKYVDGLPAFHGPVSMCGPAKGPVHALCSSSGMMVEFLALAMEMEQVNIMSEELGKPVAVMMEASSTQHGQPEALGV